jgi:hypothetical protein
MMASEPKAVKVYRIGLLQTSREEILSGKISGKNRRKCAKGRGTVGPSLVSECRKSCFEVLNILESYKDPVCSSAL